MPKVSIIIPHYRVPARVLLTLIESVLSHNSELDFEVLLVDNNEIPLVLELTDHRIRLVHQPKPGSYAARNMGVRFAKGEILAFTDADCQPSPDWLCIGIKELSVSISSFLAGDIIIQEEQSVLARYDRHIHLRQRYYMENYGFGTTANLWIKRSLFQIVGEFNEHLLSGGDMEWCERASRAGVTGTFCDECIVFHPPRSSLGSLVIKSRRFAGQSFTKHRMGIDQSANYFKAEFKSFVLRLRRSRTAVSPLDAFSFSVISTFLQMVRYLELVKLMFGKSPERR